MPPQDRFSNGQTIDNAVQDHRYYTVVLYYLLADLCIVMTESRQANVEYILREPRAVFGDGYNTCWCLAMG